MEEPEQREMLFQGGGRAGPTRPGGGRTEGVEGEKNVHLGFVATGVPSSSSKICGGGVRRGAGVAGGFREGFLGPREVVL